MADQSFLHCGLPWTFSLDSPTLVATTTGGERSRGGREVIEWVNEQVSCQNAAYLPSSSALAMQLVHPRRIHERQNVFITMHSATCLLQLGCTTNVADQGRIAH